MTRRANGGVLAAFALVTLSLAPFLAPGGEPRAPANGHRFVRISAGSYRLGREGHPRNPVRTVALAAFEIADAETTNAQFARFVEATGYVTDAERSGDGQVFRLGMLDWEWRSDPTASWRFPFGKERGGIEGKLDHPVTQISAADALAYCAWAGLRLPTLDEWEAAARAGCETLYPWGEELRPGGRALANTWDGPTHETTDAADGFVYTAPVRSYPPNAWGLYDVIGNVFEYCSDRGLDGHGHPDERLATGRGGSWWCSEKTCRFFNLVDVGQMSARGSLANQGFRVARSRRRER